MTDDDGSSSGERLDVFISRYSPEIGERARAVLAKMRTLLPGAVELVYDNYNALVVGFSPSERPSDTPVSIALYPRWVTLFFLHGADLDDPDRLLQGSGKQVRQIVVDGPAALDDPRLRRLIADAAARGSRAFDSTVPGRLVIQSASAKQRPRRPSK